MHEILKKLPWLTVIIILILISFGLSIFDFVPYDLDERSRNSMRQFLYSSGHSDTAFLDTFESYKNFNLFDYSFFKDPEEEENTEDFEFEIPIDEIEDF
jgi:hypothetical protein